MKLIRLRMDTDSSSELHPMFSHDLQGQLLSTDHTTDASAILRWGWNAFGRVSRSLRPDACGVQ